MRSVEASARRVVAHLMGLESAESTLADRSRPISPICHRALEALPRRRGLLAAERVDRAESGRTSTAIATHEAAATVAPPLATFRNRGAHGEAGDSRVPYCLTTYPTVSRRFNLNRP